MVHKLIILSIVVACVAQRGFYGMRPIGYPAIEQASTESNDLVRRFGNGQTTTTQRLPMEALGDRTLVEQLSKLPKDKQPFWLLNWQALEVNRQQGQTYQPAPSNFVRGHAVFNGPGSGFRFQEEE